jgi:hypothetical protein
METTMGESPAFDHTFKVCCDLAIGMTSIGVWVLERSLTLTQRDMIVKNHYVHSFLAAMLLFISSTQILLVGDSGVGKSSLLMRFATGTFDELSPTIGE